MGSHSMAWIIPDLEQNFRRHLLPALPNKADLNHSPMEHRFHFFESGIGVAFFKFLVFGAIF